MRTDTQTDRHTRKRFYTFAIHCIGQILCLLTVKLRQASCSSHVYGERGPWGPAKCTRGPVESRQACTREPRCAPTMHETLYKGSARPLRVILLTLFAHRLPNWSLGQPLL